LSSAATIALREPTAPLHCAVAAAVPGAAAMAASAAPAVRALRIDPLAALRHE
jgi:ABC-type lipoprotein release transport system permease subunit